jgi:SAM-dependent methyltransferase
LDGRVSDDPEDRHEAQRATVAAYDASAATYAAASPVMSDPVREAVEAFVGAVGTGGRVLEIGSGGGRDAALMEQLGLRVRRTDVTPAFVQLLREHGHHAEVVDPLTDDLTDPEGPYDGVWANASLLHVARADLPTVLARLRAVTRRGGVLRISLKEGDGEGWSTHGAVPAPRHFTYWRADALRDVLGDAGWTDVDVAGGLAGKRQETWLEVTAVNP